MIPEIANKSRNANTTVFSQFWNNFAFKTRDLNNSVNILIDFLGFVKGCRFSKMECLSVHQTEDRTFFRLLFSYFIFSIVEKQRLHFHFTNKFWLFHTKKCHSILNLRIMSFHLNLSDQKRRIKWVFIIPVFKMGSIHNNRPDFFHQGPNGEIFASIWLFNKTLLPFVVPIENLNAWEHKIILDN